VENGGNDGVSVVDRIYREFLVFTIFMMLDDKKVRRIIQKHKD
jgi:hypothetical protein